MLQAMAHNWHGICSSCKTTYSDIYSQAGSQTKYSLRYELLNTLRKRPTNRLTFLLGHPIKSP